VRCVLCFGGRCVLGFFSSSSFGWLTIGKFGCAFVAGELAFSFHIASACDVCCDLRRRRRRRRKSFLDTGSIGTLRKTLRKLVLEKQKISGN